jgi:hypothetical protein
MAMIEPDLQMICGVERIRQPDDGAIGSLPCWQLTAWAWRLKWLVSRAGKSIIQSSANQPTSNRFITDSNSWTIR